MDTFQPSAPNRTTFGHCPQAEGTARVRLRRARAGFSLVEVTLAIAVTAVAFTAILGLMTTGLAVFRQSKNIGVTSLIEQQILSQLNTMSFNTLTGSTYYSAPLTTAYRLPDIYTKPDNSVTTTYTRFFNNQGQQVASDDASGVYSVLICVTPATSFLLSTTGTTNSDLATVTIQIAYNPGRLAISPDSTVNGSSGTTLWTVSSGGNASSTTGSVPILLYRYQTLIGRNSGLN